MTESNGRPERPQPPAHPFRQTAIFYGGLAVVGFGFLLLTGQGAVRAALGAGAAFVLATSWTWWRLSRQRAGSER